MRNPIGVGGLAGHVFGFLGGAGGLLLVRPAWPRSFRWSSATAGPGAVEREQLKWLVYAGGLMWRPLAEMVIERSSA